MATVEVLEADVTALEVDAIANAATPASCMVAALRARSRMRADDIQSPNEVAPIDLGAAVETAGHRDG